MTHSSCLLLDANVVIHLFKCGAWQALVARTKLQLARTVVAEARLYFEDSGARVEIDLDSYVKSGAIEVVDVPLAQLREFFALFDPSYAEKLDAGEAILVSAAVLFAGAVVHRAGMALPSIHNTSVTYYSPHDSRGNLTAGDPLVVGCSNFGLNGYCSDNDPFVATCPSTGTLPYGGFGATCTKYVAPSTGTYGKFYFQITASYAETFVSDAAGQWGGRFWILAGNSDSCGPVSGLNIFGEPYKWCRKQNPVDHLWYYWIDDYSGNGYVEDWATNGGLDHKLVEGPTTVTVAEADIANLLWKVDTGIGLTVHMVDEASEPLPRATTWLSAPDSPMRMALVADGKGIFVQRRMLYAGSYTLTPGHGGSDGDPVSVELRDGMDNVDVTVRFNGRCAIVATVKGSDSAPIDDMMVRGLSVIDPNPAADMDDPKTPRERPYESIALGNGRFRIGHLPPGKYRVQAADGVNLPFEASSPASGIVEVSSGVVEATIVVDRSARIRGRVLDSSGQPVPDSWVSASCKRTTASAAPTLPFGPRLRPFAAKRTITNQDGQFTLSDLERSALCTVRAEQPFTFNTVGLKNDVASGVDDVVVTLAPEADATAEPVLH